MKAVTWHGKRDVRVEEVPDPTIQEPTDAIVRMTSSGLCGSDLHLYEVLGMFMHEGDILGHEPMGIVEEVGSDVEHVKPGDRVVIPFNISCGHCFMCDRGLFAQCETTQNTDHGTGASLYGYTELYGQVPGAQAEYLRVPHADFGPIPVPEDVPEDRVLYLSDILPTAWQGAAFADVQPGDTVAVLGLGPVGQFVTRSAQQMGAERVIGIDQVPERLERARAHGVETIDFSDIDGQIGDAVRDLTKGRGADGVVEAVGMEAHGAGAAKLAQTLVGALPKALAKPATEEAGIDRLGALYSAFDAVRRGGAVSISGVYGGALDPMPMMQMFDKGIQIRMGQCHVKRWIDDLMPLVLDDDDPMGTESMATHHLPIDEAPRAYADFQEKADGMVKTVFTF